MTAKAEDFAAAAREHIASRGSQETRSLYETDLRRWLEWCDKESVDPARPKLAEASRYRDLLKRQYEDQTVRRVLAELSAMYDAARRRENPAAVWNPFDAKVLERPSPDEVQLTEEISKADADRLFVAIATDAKSDDLAVRDMAVVRLLYDTGLRITPILSIKRSQLFRRDDGQLIARGFKSKKKGRVEVEIAESSADAVDRWLVVAPESQWVFPAARGGGRLGRSAINKRLDYYAKKAGLTGVHPHCFRAAYITTAFDAEVPLHEIQAAVHQSDPRSTQRYDRRARGSGVAAAVAKIREGK